ncbi:MAG: PEGA domain-containing protein, partial [Candidatus Omnitrophica bacterium]|nr:PEGA domain-containing protein [Candidatus Omnitrophota bacterium]
FYDVPILYFIGIELRQKCRTKFDMIELFETVPSKHRSSYVDFLKNNYDINNLSEEMIIDSLNKYSGSDCSDFFELYTYKDGKLSVEKLKELLLSGKELRYEANLEPFKANLSIKSNPSDAKIIINEGAKGRTPSNVKLDYGTYTIKVEKQGYETPEEKTITLHSCESKEIFFELKPIYTNAKLTILSTPRYATIYINGEEIGTSPLDHLELKPGEYTITIEKEGYETTEEKVNLKPGKAKTVTVVLKEISTPAPTTTSATSAPPTTSLSVTTTPPQDSNSFLYIGLFVVIIVLILAAYIIRKK